MGSDIMAFNRIFYAVNKQWIMNNNGWNNIDLANGLMRNRLQVIVWTNDAKIYKRIYTFGLHELNFDSPRLRF